MQKLPALQGFGHGPRERSAEVKTLAASGNDIAAMRLYRRQSGAQLRAARQLVEGLRKTDIDAHA